MVETRDADFMRLLELLPWYVNGTIGADDRAWVDTYLRTNPSAGGELEWFQKLQTELRQDSGPVPADAIWEKTLVKIRQDAEGSLPQGGASTFGRLLAWLGGASHAGSMPRFAPVMGALLAVVALQSVMLGARVSQPDSNVRSGIKGWADGPLLRVNFRPDAKESEIRFLLTEVRVLVVAGPTRLGDYFLKGAPTALPSAEERLRASDLVQSVEPVASLPESLLERQ